MEDNPHESIAIVTTSPWHSALVAVACTVLVYCLITGALLYRVNQLIDAGLQAQYMCAERAAK
jgi:hypothetical protein